jgi:hypothetical protein
MYYVSVTTTDSKIIQDGFSFLIILAFREETTFLTRYMMPFQRECPEYIFKNGVRQLFEIGAINKISIWKMYTLLAAELENRRFYGIFMYATLFEYVNMQQLG